MQAPFLEEDHGSLKLLYAIPAALHSENNDHIVSYLRDAPEAKGRVLQDVKDFDTYLTERFLVSTSGVVKCAAPPKTDRPKRRQDEPELAKTFRPSAMQAFMRINLSRSVQSAVLVIRQIDQDFL